MLTNAVYIIHETTDYDKFDRDPANRPIDYGHLQRLKEAIRKKNLLAEFPIVVDSDMKVLDGNHRLQAARELGLSIYYIVSQTMKERDVPGSNDARRQWRLEDYLHRHVTKGIPDYVALKRFSQQYPEIKLSDAIALCYLNGNESGSWYGDVAYGKKHVDKLYIDGDYICNNLPFAEAVAMAVRGFKRYFPKHFAQRQFVRAIANLVANPQYDHDRMLQKLEYLSAKLRPCVTSSDYILMLNEIYNYKVRPKDKVEFKLRQVVRPMKTT